MRAVHGFLINAKEHSITPVIHNAEDYKEIYKFIEATCFTVVRLNDNDDVVYVDDEGLLNNPRYFFNINGYPDPLAGNGLVLGTDEEGDTVSAKLSEQWLRDNITFSEHKMLGFHVEEGEADILGSPGWSIKSIPIFGPPDETKEG